MRSERAKQRTLLCGSLHAARDAGKSLAVRNNGIATSKQVHKIRASTIQRGDARILSIGLLMLAGLSTNSTAYLLRR
jgi:hypothetical protein